MTGLSGGAGDTSDVAAGAWPGSGVAGSLADVGVPGCSSGMPCTAAPSSCQEICGAPTPGGSPGSGGGMGNGQGGGGKESADNTVRNLQGFTCKIEKVTGDKVTRAEPLSCQVEIGNFYVVEGEYLHGQEGFMNQVKMLPNGKLKDMIDAAGGAYNKLTTNQSLIEML